MRRKILALVAGLMLVGAGVAVAHGFDSKAVKQVSATFTATTVSNLRTSTCTGADGSYAKSVANYSGTAVSSEPSLNGATRIEAASFVNTTTGVGTVWGNARIDTADGRRTSFASRASSRTAPWSVSPRGAAAPAVTRSSCWRTSRPTTARPAASRTASSAAAPLPATRS